MNVNALAFNIMLYAAICVQMMLPMQLDVVMQFLSGITTYNATIGFLLVRVILFQGSARHHASLVF